MDTVTIFLGVLLLLVIVYFVFYSGEKELSGKIDLSQPQTAVQASSLDQPSSAKYSMEMWIYVYKFSPTGQYIIYRAADGESENGKKNIGIKLDANSPKLVLEYAGSPASGTGIEQKSVTITDNLPLQSWVHLIVSIDGAFVDVYINGKLVKSFQDSGIKAPSSNASIAYGNPDVYLAKLTRYTKATDPQTAWEKYMAGNGENPFAKVLSSFGLTMTLQKNNQDYSKITLF
jgi:hypothetical protein